MAILKLTHPTYQIILRLIIAAHIAVSFVSKQAADKMHAGLHPCQHFLEPILEVHATFYSDGSFSAMF